MKSPDPPADRQAVDYTPEIDGVLALFASVHPREGLEQRVLARLVSAPSLPWYRRFSIVPVAHHPWAFAAASAVIVAGVTLSAYRHHPAVAPTPIAVHAPHAAAQPAAAAADVGVSDHPLEPNKTTSRHRGIRRSYRAMHGRVPLPRGTAVPIHPRTVPASP